MDTKNVLTIDVIIAKFVPILGAILFITWFWYLIYTSVWEAMSQAIRLWIWFFASFVIIGAWFSFSERLRYFSDVFIWGWILLLYGTLIYGSRTTDLAVAIIPEVATLVTAFIFTIIVAYFSSLRKSKVILVLGMLGAYLTPFVIWQNDVWASNISFNAYLVYFSTVNIVIFLLGKEVSTHDLIPLNLLGLFFGTYTFHSLIYSDVITIVHSEGFFVGNNFTLLLLAVIVSMGVFSIIYSSTYFKSKDEVWISAGYLIPLIWFLFQKEPLIITPIFELLSFLFIGCVYFVAWFFLRPMQGSRYQHVAAYAGWVICIIFAINTFFSGFNLYSSLLVAYTGCIFSGIYLFDGNKGERLLSAFFFSFLGGVLSFSYIYGKNPPDFPTIFSVLSLLPAISLAPLVHLQGKTPESVKKFLNIYSLIAFLLAILVILLRVLKSLDFWFAIFVLPGFLMVLFAYIQGNKNPTRGTLMRIGSIWVSVGFFWSFLYFIANFIPHVADTKHFWIDGGIFANWHFIKGIFAIMTYFLALKISRQIQKEEKSDRPSFLLVIFAYTSLLLVVNFSIITFCNDLWIVFTTGWVRAILTTLWWVVLSIFMLLIGIKYGHEYRSEKLLGLVLLFLSVGKIAFYDLSTMEMNKKIIVLMIVGWLIMFFSYFLQIKGYLKDKDVE